jgi:hypothetical protein
MGGGKEEKMAQVGTAFRVLGSDVTSLRGHQTQICHPNSALCERPDTMGAGDTEEAQFPFQCIVLLKLDIFFCCFFIEKDAEFHVQ